MTASSWKARFARREAPTHRRDGAARRYPVMTRHDRPRGSHTGIAHWDRTLGSHSGMSLRRPLGLQRPASSLGGLNRSREGGVMATPSPSLPSDRRPQHELVRNSFCVLVFCFANPTCSADFNQNTLTLCVSFTAGAYTLRTASVLKTPRFAQPRPCGAFYTRPCSGRSRLSSYCLTDAYLKYEASTACRR